MKKLLLLGFVLAGMFSQAQVSNDKVPPSWTLGIIPNTDAITLPEIDIQALKQEDLINDSNLVNKPYRFGEKIDVALDLFNSGEWTELDNGDRIWQLNIVSAGAKTINLLFDRYDLPKGAELYLYTDNRSDQLGPYTENENQENGVLGTWVVYGDNIWVEYYEPASVKGLGRVSIDTVVHGYRGFNLPNENVLKLNESGDCNVDVNCNPNAGSTNGVDWTTIRNNYRDGVARIIINGAGLCTGTMINNVREDGTPYFYTANHCLGGVADGVGSAYNAANWSFGFEWYTNTPDCATFANTVGPFNPVQVISGATLRMNHRNSDTALFELNQTPPAFWDLYYGGWENRFITPSAQLCIHHPSGDIMKLARNDQSVNAQSVTIGGVTAQVWRVANWDYGVTEGGSSGSILLNPSGHIIGELYGGSAFCSGTNDNGQPDFYGRFNVAWAGGGTNSTRLSNWLDPDSTGTTTYDGDFYSTLSNSSIDREISVVAYPNPVINSVTVSITEEATYELYSISGKIIQNGELNNGENLIDFENVSSGVYFMVVNSGTRSQTIKLVKE